LDRYIEEMSLKWSFDEIIENARENSLKLTGKQMFMIGSFDLDGMHMHPDYHSHASPVL